MLLHNSWHQAINPEEITVIGSPLPRPCPIIPIAHVTPYLVLFGTLLKANSLAHIYWHSYFWALFSNVEVVLKLSESVSESVAELVKNANVAISRAINKRIVQ